MPAASHEVPPPRTKYVVRPARNSPPRTKLDIHLARNPSLTSHEISSRTHGIMIWKLWG